jgi:hypothetical protein
MNSAKKNENRTAEMRFGSPPAENNKRQWREQMEYLIKTDNSRKSVRSYAAKLPTLEEYIKNWITGRRNNGIAAYTKIILLEARRLAFGMSIIDFADWPVNA